ncbi:hypothetical protein DY000_02036144 [Brassica cretica]|uniref:Uncharacterized protein n=1 Tax=Brassica cretica TaxID=69181 RepID=A0ABQ7DUH9_BRACR|nr:hypothetical protein DY000_02036144 [Brassica cretica]
MASELTYRRQEAEANQAYPLHAQGTETRLRARRHCNRHLRLHPFLSILHPTHSLLLRSAFRIRNEILLVGAE